MIPLRLVELVEGQSGWAYEAGDVFPCWNHQGSHDVEGRGPCWVVRLPGRGYIWHSNMESSDGTYWEVSGEPPLLTVSPSINVGPEIWHGWITNGELSPDTDYQGDR